MRTQYRNGDTKTLVYQNCDSCEAIHINGRLCHETGCPDAWRDEVRECKECGNSFNPVERYQDCCSDECSEVYHC